MIYFLTFLGLAFFPLLLAALGGHLATLVLPIGRKRAFAIWAVWALFLLSVACSAIVEVWSYRSDKRKDVSESDFRSQTIEKLNKIIAEPVQAKRTEAAQALKNGIVQTSPARTSSAPKPLMRPASPQPLPDENAALLTEVYNVANEIDNVGEDYNIQTAAVLEGRSDVPPDFAKSEEPFKEMRADQIRSFELNRYNTLYRDKATELRAKMLAKIPDVLFQGLNTTETITLYQTPTNGLGLKAVADNLRALAKSFQLKSKTDSSR